MTIKYVDFEGAAGTGDGSSFANRAAKLNDVSGLTGGDTIRIKKSPDPTSLGTGIVKRTLPHLGYSARSNSDTFHYSSTTGESYWDESSSGNWSGWEENDVIHFVQSTEDAGENLNGLYRVNPTNGGFNQGGGGKVKLLGFASSSSANGTTSTTSRKLYAASSCSIILNTSGITKSIACRDAARSAFTAATGVTTDSCVMTSGDWNTPHDWILGTGSDKFELPSSISAGKAAHFQLPSALDLSGYQQISFMVRNYSGRSSTAHDSIRLCTDTDGNTSVHTIPINTRNASTGSWIPVVVDLGTNLNSSIQSIAIYRDTTGTTRNYYISNIIACKASSAADSLTHYSQVGLNTTADPVWYPISAIWDDIILLRVSSNVQGNFGYYNSHAAFFSADNNSATIYKRDPIIFGEANSSTTGLNTVQNSGTSAESQLTISGGWDDTNMSTQNGKTFLLGNGYGRFVNPQNYNLFTDIYLSYYYHGFYFSGKSGCGLKNVGVSCFYKYGIYMDNCTDITHIGVDYLYGFYSDGFWLRYCSQWSSYTASNFFIKYHKGSYSSNGWYPQYLSGAWVWDHIRAENTNNGISLWSSTGGFHINNLYGGNHANSYASSFYSPVTIGNYYIYQTNYAHYLTAAQGNCTINNYVHTILDNKPSGGGRRYGQNLSPSACMQVSAGTSATILDGSVDKKFYFYGGTVKTNSLVINDSVDASWNTSNSGKLLMRDYDGVSGSYKNVYYDGQINPETSVRHTASGFAWKFIFDNASNTFLSVDIGKIIVNNGSLVTIGVWTYKTATNKVAKLVLKKNTLIGMTADVVANNSSASVNTWTKIEATFTPNAKGVCEIILKAESTSGTSDYVYFDDLEVAQA